MTNSIKISADTSEFKKSLLDLGKELKSVQKSKIALFSEADKNFIKRDFSSAIKGIKNQIIENRNEVSKLLQEHKKLQTGTQEELSLRNKILDSYKEQARLGQQINTLQNNSKDLGGGVGIGGLAKGILGGIAGAAAIAGGYALVRGKQAADQFQAGAGNRVRLRGLGQESLNVGGAGELASLGMTEQEFIERQTGVTSALGRRGGSRKSILGQAGFERAYGLSDGTLGGVASSFGQTFGKEADQTQLKLQASIIASGIEDAIGPYLEITAGLLNSINKNGMTNVDQLIRAMSSLTANSGYTPGQLSNTFNSLNSGIKNSSGEANAFFQTAFGRAGIGGGLVGGARFAIQSGGLFGLNSQDLLNKGYNPQLVGNFGKMGITSGLRERGGAILDEIKARADLGGRKIRDISDPMEAIAIGNLGNSFFGTSGEQGFDAIKLLEKAVEGGLSQKGFDRQLKALKESNDPILTRLSSINSSLEGVTDILKKTQENTMERLGKSTIKALNMMVAAETVVISKVASGAESLNSKIGDDANSLTKALSTDGIGGFFSKLAEIIAKPMAEAQRTWSPYQLKPKIDIKIQNSDGKVTEKTYK